jgi:hypothetical protein
VTTFEEASECPKCHHPGKQVGAKPAGQGRGTLITLMCMTAVCPWFETTYVVQRKPDGTVPEPDTSRRLTRPIAAPTDAMTERAVADAAAWLAASVNPNNEIRR